MSERILILGRRFGWGALIAAAPFLNAIAVITAGLGCFVLVLFFSLFGVQPCPPDAGGNLLSWALYLLFGLCYGWFVWSRILFIFLIPLGMAWSLADLLIARATGDRDRFAGAMAGLALTLLPIVLYFQATPSPGQNLQDLLRLLAHTQKFAASGGQIPL